VTKKGGFLRTTRARSGARASIDFATSATDETEGRNTSLENRGRKPERKDTAKPLVSEGSIIRMVLGGKEKEIF